MINALEHALKRFYQFLARSLALALWGAKDNREIDMSEVEHIGVFLAEKLGDLFVALPLVDKIRENYPAITITAITSLESKALIANDPRFNHVETIPYRIIPGIKAAFNIRKRNFDLLLDLNDSDSNTALVVSLCLSRGVARIVGVGKKKFARYYDRAYETLDGVHNLFSLAQVLAALGIEPKSVSRLAQPYLPECTLVLAKEFLADEDSGDTNQTLWIGLNLSAGDSMRIWPVESYRQTAAEIYSEYPCARFLLFCVANDRYRAEELKRVCESQIKIIPQGSSIQSACAFLSQMDLLITPDTSLTHMARSFDVPVVALCRDSEHFEYWKPLGQDEGAIKSKSSDGIASIQWKEVSDVAIRLLKKSAKGSLGQALQKQTTTLVAEGDSHQ
ncbi:MAG: glycosyltransferase family 9 protein [candidate division Zixibacteria bacterium]|nr:glycosyltransferase family 9 protein [candidate division Zixibacteria bacterium]